MWSSFCFLEYARFIKGRRWHLPTLPKQDERVKPSLPVSEAASPLPRRPLVLISRSISHSACNLFFATITVAQFDGRGCKFKETPITVIMFDASFLLSADNFHPHISMKFSHASIPDAAVSLFSTLMTSSTQCVAAILNRTAAHQQNRAGYLEKFSGDDLEPNTWQLVTK
jgi:hypothetical protein